MQDAELNGAVRAVRSAEVGLGVPVDAVVAGLDAERAPGDLHVGVGVDGVVGGVQNEAAAADGDVVGGLRFLLLAAAFRVRGVAGGLEALAAHGVLVEGTVVPAASGGDLKASAADGQILGGLDAVAGGLEGEAAPGDGDAARTACRGVHRVGIGADAVASGGADCDLAPVDGQSVVAGDAVFHGADVQAQPVDGQTAGCAHLQGVLGAAYQLQRARAVEGELGAGLGLDHRGFGVFGVAAVAALLRGAVVVGVVEGRVAEGVDEAAQNREGHSGAGVLPDGEGGREGGTQLQPRQHQHGGGCGALLDGDGAVAAAAGEDVAASGLGHGHQQLVVVAVFIDPVARGVHRLGQGIVRGTHAVLLPGGVDAGDLVIAVAARHHGQLVPIEDEGGVADGNVKEPVAVGALDAQPGHAQRALLAQHPDGIAPELHDGQVVVVHLGGQGREIADDLRAGVSGEGHCAARVPLGQGSRHQAQQQAKAQPPGQQFSE